MLDEPSVAGYNLRQFLSKPQYPFFRQFTYVKEASG